MTVTTKDSEPKWTEATIEVSIQEELDINEICEQIENTLGWCIDRAWIKGALEGL